MNHGEVVSDFECFSFGVHKFLKVAQRGRGDVGRPAKGHKYSRHMRNCARIRDLYRSSRARRHQLALTGMFWAMHHREVSSLFDKSSLLKVFESEVCGAETSWRKRVDRLSNSIVVWRLALMQSLGRRRAFA